MGDAAELAPATRNPQFHVVMPSYPNDQKSLMPPFTWMLSPSLSTLRRPLTADSNTVQWRNSMAELGAAKLPAKTLIPYYPKNMNHMGLTPLNNVHQRSFSDLGPQTNDKELPQLPLKYDDMIERVPLAPKADNFSHDSDFSNTRFASLPPSIQAQLLFDCAPNTIPLSQHAEYLGGTGDLRAAVRFHYFEHFNFSNKSLDRSLRTLCSKLYLRAETQQLDRVLYGFAQRYFDCNPRTVFKSLEGVHTVAFSMFLLNTDLHLADVQSRMSRSQFVRNTMESLSEHDDLLKRSSTPLPSPDSQMHSFSTQDLRAQARQQARGSNGRTLVRHLSVISRRSTECSDGGEKGDIQDILRDLYASVRHEPIPVPTSCLELESEDPKSDIDDNHPEQSITMPSVSPKGPLMSGPVALRDETLPTWRKHWMNAYAEMTHGSMRLYKSSGTNGKTASHWRDIALQHALANMSSVPKREYQLLTASGKVYSIRVPNATDIQQWVDTSNYCAARTSKPRMKGALTNIDYGWQNVCPTTSQQYKGTNGVCTSSTVSLKSTSTARAFPRAISRMFQWHSNDNSPAVGEWVEPKAPHVLSTLTLAEQAAQTAECLASLRQELQDHDSVHMPMQAYWAVWPDARARAMANWERKRAYLVRELVKYAKYSATLDIDGF